MKCLLLFALRMQDGSNLAYLPAKDNPLTHIEVKAIVEMV